MKTRGIEFGPITCAAGARGFFKEPYRHQKFMGPVSPNWEGCGFITKTATRHRTVGNMPMQKDGITPVEFSPACIAPNLRMNNLGLSLKMFLRGYMLNAVGLSGPGIVPLLEKNKWQEEKEPFWISFMTVEKDADRRIQETYEFVNILRQALPSFQAPIGLEQNCTCSNVGFDVTQLVGEMDSRLDCAAVLGIPQRVKINLVISVEAAKAFADNPNCDEICTTNTIGFGKIPDVINWPDLFPGNISPLGDYTGKGALSGAPLLHPTANWIRSARKAGISKPIHAGGGILCPEDLEVLHEAGATSVFIGSVATLRPWRVQAIIKRAYQLFK